VVATCSDFLEISENNFGSDKNDRTLRDKCEGE